MKKQIIKKETVTKKIRKKNIGKKSYPTFLYEKKERKQLVIKETLRRKFLLCYLKQKESSTPLACEIKSSYSQIERLYSIKNTKSCVVTRKKFIMANSNINSHIFKFLAGKGRLTNIKKSIW